jgi:glycerol-3-phosphate dehydrogenase (NAD(P)+)
MESLCVGIWEALRGLEPCPLLLSLCKGIQSENLGITADLVGRILPGVEYGVLAGPTNAMEIALGMNAAMVLASTSKGIYKIQEALNSHQIRIYSSVDVRGVELGGCLKNVYAIGSGICDGLKLGDNGRAAYLTRSLREMVAIGTALGGQRETFYGLSGFGDFIATCTGRWSRNRTFGEKIGGGERVDAILSSQKSVVEGYRTARSLSILCEKIGVDAPILSEIHAVLYLGKPMGECVDALIHRSLKAEC